MMTTKDLTEPEGRDEAGHELGALAADVSEGGLALSEAFARCVDEAGAAAAAAEKADANLAELAAMGSLYSASTTKARQIAESTKAVSDEGRDAMTRMTESMEQIRASSRNTAEILRDINDIAFQTNLLALNAAVEAARAGDAGRGFAVVAQEVRTLAQRAKEAARKTEALVQQSASLADTGHQLSTEVSDKLVRIGESVDEIATITKEIADAGSEQARGIASARSAVKELHAATDRIAEGHVGAGSVIQSLVDRAGDLMEATGGARPVEAAPPRRSVAAPSRAPRLPPQPRARPATTPSRPNGTSKHLAPKDVIPLDDDLESF